MPVDPELESRATKLTLISVFLGILGTFSSRLIRREQDLQLRPFDLVLLGLATYRAGHMIAYERIAEPLRDPFTRTKPDDSGAGDTVVAKGAGVQRSLGELLSCPICVGTWTAAALVYGLHLIPRPTRVFLAIMSATGLAEVIYALTEALSWWGRASRAASAASRAEESGSSTPVHASH